jgi:uncharacterized protein YndB with AHSA1/START domain
MCAMEQPTVVTRTVELEMSPDDLWSLIGDGERWAEWMVDDSDVEVSPDGEGSVTDDGVDRRVRVRDIVSGERVRFDWWPAGEPDVISAVELAVVPSRSGAVLRIVETFPARTTVAARASVAWAVRATCLWARCGLLVGA